MKVVAVANQKGGVGKTTTAVNLSVAVAISGKKVLLVDLDPQGNASTGLGIRMEKRKFNSHGLINSVAGSVFTTTDTCVPNLQIIPAVPDLASVEGSFGLYSDKTLRERLRGVCRGYDYVFIT